MDLPGGVGAAGWVSPEGAGLMTYHSLGTRTRGSRGKSVPRKRGDLCVVVVFILYEKRKEEHGLITTHSNIFGHFSI